MSYTYEEVKKLYETLRRDCEAWHEIAANWKRSAEVALEVLRDLEWGPRVQHAGICYQCPSCHAWKEDGHQGDCALSAVLTTGRRQRPEVPGGESEAETGELVVTAESYDELLTSYLKLARERVLVNALCVVSGLVALVVLAVQVYNVLGRGY